MKTVDENYSYDELEGFQTVDLGRRESADILWLSAGGKSINLSRGSRKIILTAEYVQFLYNAETKQLLVAAAAQPGRNTIAVNKAMDTSGFSAKVVYDLLERETKRDLNVVRIRIYGTKVKSKRAAVIFDLGSMVATKIKRAEKK